MKTLHFSTSIAASREKVWNTLWDDKTYRQWTAVFSEGSYAESDWNEGSNILFLGPGGDGMFAIIEKKDENEEMVFRHLGEIKNGVEEVKNWGGAKERYVLKQNNGITTLDVSVDVTPDFEDYFNDAFPKSLAVVKQIAEQ